MPPVFGSGDEDTQGGTQPAIVGEARPVEPSSKQWSFSLPHSITELCSSLGGSELCDRNSNDATSASDLGVSH
jgi:hypothetical protein